MNIQEEVKAVEKELLELIIKHLEENKIEIETARKLASDFLAVLPIQDQKDLLVKLKGLGQTYPEAKQVYVTELEKVSVQQRDNALSQMRDAIKMGKIEEAIKTAKSMQPLV